MTWRMGLAAIMVAATAGLAVAQDAPSVVQATPKILNSPASGATNSFVDAVPSTKGFVATWNNTRPGAPPLFLPNTSIYVQSFSPTGAALKPAVKVRGPVVQGVPRIAAIGGDKFVIVWRQFTTLEGGIFDLATNKFSNFKVIVPTNGVHGSTHHEVVYLANGRIAVMVMQTFGLASQTVRVYTFNKTLTKLSGPVTMNGGGYTSYGTSNDFTLVNGQTGGFAIWRDRPTGNLYMKAFTAAGATSGAQRKVNTTALPNGTALDVAMFGVSAVKLSTHRILVTWTSLENLSGKLQYDIRGRLFSPTGAPIGNDFRVNTDRVETQYYPEPIALPSGRFAIGWVSNVFSTLTRKHVIRNYLANGTPKASPVVTHSITNPTDSNVDTSAALLKDGSVVNVFHEGPGQRVVGDGVPASVVK